MKFNRLSFDYCAPDGSMYSVEIGFGCGIVIGKTPDTSRYCWLGKYWQKELVARVNACRIHQWEDIYYSEHGTGEAWGVKLILDGKVVFHSCGLNEFPPNWDIFMSVVGRCLNFLNLDENDDEDETQKNTMKKENRNQRRPRR